MLAFFFDHWKSWRVIWFPHAWQLSIKAMIYFCFSFPSQGKWSERITAFIISKQNQILSFSTCITATVPVTVIWENPWDPAVENDCVSEFCNRFLPEHTSDSLKSLHGMRNASTLQDGDSLSQHNELQGRDDRQMFTAVKHETCTLQCFSDGERGAADITFPASQSE